MKRDAHWQKMWCEWSKPPNRHAKPLSVLESLLLAAVFLVQSPLNPAGSGISGTDSSVFRFVARVMQRGGLPYLDTFDHKGPLLYLLNWLAMSSDEWQARLLWASLFVSSLSSLVLICISGYSFAHYGMVLVPLLIPSIATVVGRIFQLKLPRCRVVACFIMFTIALTGIDGLAIIRGLSSNAVSLARVSIPKYLLVTCDAINTYASAGEPIAVFGNYDMVYLQSEHPSATRWSYTFPILDADGAMVDEYFSALDATRPSVVVVGAGMIEQDQVAGTPSARMADYLNRSGYKPVMEDEGVTYVVYALKGGPTDE